MARLQMKWTRRIALCAAAAVLSVATAAWNPASAAELLVEASHSTLVKSPRPMGEVIVADPSVADVHAHGTMYLSVIGKKVGETTIRIFDKQRQLLESYEVHVGYNLVAIRKALKDFLPDELIGVEMVNRNIALTGQVSNAAAADKAVRIVREFLASDSSGGGAASPAKAAAGGGAQAGGDKSGGGDVLNLMQVTSGQQVMLRVRVGEVQRSALKDLGVDLTEVARNGVSSVIFGTGNGIASLVAVPSGGTTVTPGQFLLPGGQTPTNTQAVLAGSYQPHGPNGKTLSGLIHALEEDGLFKLLAEPNLVAVSGEQAEFLAGGEIPVPVPQSGTGGSTTITIDYKPFGVGVKFRPVVLTENRIRIDVQPEVSELDFTNAITLSGTKIPAISTRRAKTTVELAPGESFMIAGLIKDEARSTIDQLPGVKNLPVLGALFRSSDFQRNETELVIAVTPYIVDPMKSGDVRLPTDNFAPASQMEMIFYGALGTLSGNASRISRMPSAEGPVGFMVD